MNFLELLNMIFKKEPRTEGDFKRGIELYRQVLAIVYSPEHDAIMDRLDTDLMRRYK